MTKTDSGALSTGAKDERVGIVEGKPSKKLLPVGNPRESKGGILPVDKMLHWDQDTRRHLPQRISGMPTVAAVERKIEKGRGVDKKGKREEEAVAPSSRKRVREDDYCIQCGYSRQTSTALKRLSFSGLTCPTSTHSSLISSATSPVAHKLSPSSIPKVTTSPGCIGLPTFTLEVTAQAVPASSWVLDPPLTLCLCFLETFFKRWPRPSRGGNAMPATALAFQQGEGLEVCQKREAAVAQYQSFVARLLYKETAFSDVYHLLTSLAGCNGAPWVLMPIASFTDDAVTRIHRFLRLHGCHRFGSSRFDRVICHLDVTARTPH